LSNTVGLQPSLGLFMGVAEPEAGKLGQAPLLDFFELLHAGESVCCQKPKMTLGNFPHRLQVFDHLFSEHSTTAWRTIA